MFSILTRKDALTRELETLAREEQKLREKALTAETAQWKTLLEDKVPEKVVDGLKITFSKAFGIVFKQGTVIIEKGINEDELKAVFDVRDYAVQRKTGKKELRQMRKGNWKSELVNLSVTTVEGLGLGALGIGVPDVVLFLANLLKGIYEMALNYGFDYHSPEERYLILKMMEAALQKGQDWERINREVDALLEKPGSAVTEDMLKAQTRDTASAFALDMVLLKFIQGIPVVGMLGGAANPVYYRRIMRYVELKYRKRYLKKLPRTV